MDKLEKELEQSHIIKCKGATIQLGRELKEPVEALLRVYKNGKVDVSCRYLCEKGNKKGCVVGVTAEAIPCTYQIK